MSYLASTVTFEEFLNDKSAGQKKQIKSTLSHLDRFTQERYQLDAMQVISDLGKEKNEEKTIIFLNQFLGWMQLDHPEIQIKFGKNHHSLRTFSKLAPRTIRFYIRYIKEVLEDCYGL